MREKVTAWLHGRLTKADIARLNGNVVPVSPESDIGMADLVRAWLEHQLKLEADLLLPSSDRSLWGAHDYVAMLIIRDLISQGLDSLDLNLRLLVEPVVADLDQRFMNFTEPDLEGYAERIDGKIKPGRDWWWRRLPKRGPVREEILADYG